MHRHPRTPSPQLLTPVLSPQQSQGDCWLVRWLWNVILREQTLASSCLTARRTGGEKREDQIVSIRCPRAPGPDYKGRHGAMTLCKELSDYGGQVSKLSQSAIDFYKTRCCRLERKKERDRQRQTDRQTDRQTNTERQRSSWVNLAVLGQTQLLSRVAI